MKTLWKWLAGAVALLAVVVAFFIGQGTPIVKTKAITLTVVAQEGSFDIVAVDTLQVKAGEDVGFTVNVNPIKGFAKAVKFTVSGGPAGMTVTWQPKATGVQGGDTWYPGDPGNLVCDLAIPLDNTLVGTHPITLTGTAQ